MDKLQVGDSFHIPKAKAGRISTTLYAAAKRTNIRITVRQYLHEGIDGVMVWRTA